MFLCIKTELQKITNFLDINFDNKVLPKFVTKNGLKFMINHKEITILIKKLELKLQWATKIDNFPRTTGKR